MVSHIQSQQHIKKYLALAELKPFSSKIFFGFQKEMTSIVKKRKKKNTVFQHRDILPKYSFNSSALYTEGPVRALRDAQKSP